ncbi:MAG: oxidoreductase [Bacteroidetes bacterium]|nr:oxidoreductase [Bacteroidota bacterium]
MKSLFSLAFLFFVIFSFSQSYVIHYDSVECLGRASIRGVSVVDDSVAWISGSKGTVARTLDGGKTWEKIPVPGYEKNDFRSIEAFDRSMAYISSTSNPAVVLLTRDGGKSWSTVMERNEKSVFFDALCCWDRFYLILLADPKDGKFFIQKIVDGKVILPDSSNLYAPAGESCFAASGTCLRIDKRGRAWFVTGGAQSRLFYSRNYGGNWNSYPIPVVSGKSSQGAFSIAFSDAKHAVVVGGDYTDPKSTEKNCLTTSTGGTKWKISRTPPGGYRSCVEYISGKTFICTGTTGSDVSFDHGKTWMNFDTTNFNVVRKAKKGKLIIIAGDKGRVGTVITTP